MKFRNPVLCILVPVFYFIISGISHSLLWGGMEFRHFDSDRDRLERYIDRGKDEESISMWQNLADTAREELTASWERDAEEATRRYIAQGFSEDVVATVREEAFGDWERELYSVIISERGKWFAEKEKGELKYPSFDSLIQKTQDVSNNDEIDSAAKWDISVEDILDAVNRSFEDNLRDEISRIREEGSGLLGAERESFEKHVVQIEGDFRKNFSLERDTILYRARNGFIKELFRDLSLKSQSDESSADVVTGEMINKVEQDIREEENRILNRSSNEDGNVALDFSNLGDNWQEELKRLIESGMNSWSLAREKLCNEMIAWTSEAQDSYESADAKWRKASQQIEEAKNNWENNLRQEIYNGIENWQKQESELVENIETARDNLNNYIDNLNSQWSDHSQGLIDMAINGSSVYAEAVTNIKWLEEMCPKYVNQGAFGLKDVESEASDDFFQMLDESSRERVLQGLVNNRDVNSLQSEYGRTYDDYQIGRFRKTCDEVPDWILNFDIFGSSGSSTKDSGYSYYNPQDKYLGQWYYSKKYYRKTFLGGEWKKNSNGVSYFQESYKITLYGDKMSYVNFNGLDDLFDYKFGNYRWYKFAEELDSFEITNIVNEESSIKEKSSYYYYNTELERWNKIKDNFKQIAIEAESYMHDWNMKGENSGPGYLVQNGTGDGDPYLMTQAEFNFEIAERDRLFWERRLEIARAVYDYAYLTNGKRESAEETENRKRNAEENMKIARESYDSALIEIGKIVEELKKIQGGDPSSSDYGESIEALTEEYLKSKGVLERAEANFQSAKTAVIFIENKEDTEYLKNQIAGIEKKILESKELAYTKRTEYYKLLAEKGYATITANYAGLYESAVLEKERSSEVLNIFNAIVFGEETDESLTSWAEEIYQKREDIWSDEADEKGILLKSLIDDFKNASGEEKEEKYQNLSEYIRSLSFTFQSEAGATLKICEILRNDDFNVNEYLDGASQIDPSTYSKYAEVSMEAQNVLSELFNEFVDKDEEIRDYDSMAAYLKNIASSNSYVYGGDNGVYLKYHCAVKIFEERYQGLNHETWGTYRAMLDDERAKTRLICDFYEDYNEFEIDDYMSELESGDTGKISLFLEYNNSGSSIAGFSYILEYDKSAEVDLYIRDSVMEYVREHADSLRSVAGELARRDYLQDLLGFINIRISISDSGNENEPFSLENISNLDYRGLTIAADAVSEYIESRKGAGIPLSEYINAAALHIKSLRDSLADNIYIEDYMAGRIEGTADELYQDALANYDIVNSVMNFIFDGKDIMESESLDNIQSTQKILELWDDMGDSARSWVKENENDEIKKVSTFSAKIGELYNHFNLIQKALSFSDSSLTPDQYRDFLNLTDEDGIKLMDMIVPVYERAEYDSYLLQGNSGTIQDYILTRNLSEEQAKDLLSYCMIKNYIAFTSVNDLSGHDSSFDSYVKYKKFQDYLTSLEIFDEEPVEDFISRATLQYVATYGGEQDEYFSFAEDYLDGKIKAFKYLPEEVALFQASNDYYKEVFSAGKIIREDDLRDFLSDKYGSESPDSDFFDDFMEYARELNAITLFTGKDLDNYRETLDGHVLEAFDEYIRGTEGGILPEFDLGLYGNYTPLNFKMQDTVARIACELEGFYANLVIMSTVENSLNEAERRFYNSQALNNFLAGTTDGSSWRDLFIPGVGEDITVSLLQEEGGSAIYDVYDEDGNIESIRFSPSSYEKDGWRYSSSLAIDDANKLYLALKSLLSVADYDYSECPVDGIDEFLAKVDIKYDISGKYERDKNGDWIFESDLRDLVSGYETIASNYESAYLRAKGELESHEGSIDRAEHSLTSKGLSFKFMIGNDENEKSSLEEFEKYRNIHEQAKTVYTTLGDKLRKAQEEYNKINESYISQMSLVADLYSQYKEFEFAYEKAFSIWEYASTPYLKDASSGDSGLGGGELPGTDEGTDYGKIDLPDAADNYQRIKAKYDQVLDNYNSKKAYLSKQESVSDLNSDSEYVKLKANFIRTSESYIRISQVGAELDEKIGEYAQMYNQAKGNYEQKRDSFSFFIEAVDAINADEGLSAEEKSVAITNINNTRDKIFAHLKTSTDVNNLLNGIKWYSCVKNIEQHLIWYSFFDGWTEFYKHSSDYYARRGSLKLYNELPSQTRQDVVTLYETFKNTKSMMDIMDNYHLMMEYQYYADYYDHKYNSTKKFRVFSRKKWRRRRDNYKSKFRSKEGLFNGSYNVLSNQFNDFINAKSELISAKNIINNSTSEKYLINIKSYLQGSDEKYFLENEDLSHLYDSTNIDGFNIDGESINISVLRGEVEREDVDGLAVRARIVNGRIVVLNRDGEVTGEIYETDNPGVLLKNNDVAVTQFEEGKEYSFYDLNYNILDIINIVKNKTFDLRNEYYSLLMDYVNKSVQAGDHDYTIVLRDLEETFNGLMNTAVKFNYTGDDGEIRQRSFNGYATIVKEYVHDDEWTSVQDLIIKEIMKQNRSFQEQVWTQQNEKFSLRKDRWMEVTGYILNRGKRDWVTNENEFYSRWNKWRFEAQKSIEDGVIWWQEREKNLTSEMNMWRDESSKASTMIVADNMFREMESKLLVYEKDMKKKMPGSSFDIDVNSVLGEALKKMPVGSVGVLSESMFATDTVAGFNDMINLNQGFALFEKNDAEMEEYNKAFGVMKNLMVIDVLNGIIDGFNKQLIETNKNVYESVESNMRGNKTLGRAPFKRKKTENRWEIKVCVESTLAKDKYKMRRFTDYKNYLNTTVFFKPIKGLNGKIIDFTQANTYVNLDSEDLDRYVGLESEWLNREVDKVFGEDGTFRAHQEEEFSRIFEMFGKYYGEWMAGEALLDGYCYNKPIFPHGPNMLQTATMVAGVTGGPWAAFAVNTLATGMQVTNGSMSWKQGAFQVGMSATTAMIGIGAGELGAMFEGASQIAVENVTRTAANTLVSGISLEGNGLGYDKKRMTSARTWLAAGATSGAGILSAGLKLEGFSSALVNGVGSTLSAGITTGDWSESFKTGAISAAGNYLGGLLGKGISQGLGTENAYTKELINNYTTFGMRKLLGGDEKFDMGSISQVDTMNLVVQDMYQSYKAKDKTSKTESDPHEKSSENASDKFKDPFAALDQALSGIFVSLGRGLGQTMKDVANVIKNGAVATWQGVSNFGQRTKNWFKYGDFESASDLNMTKEEYAEWQSFKASQEALGIEVGYTTTKLDTSSYMDFEKLRDDKAKEVITNFRKDTRDETDRKIEELKFMGLDTSEIEAKVANMRAELRKSKAAAKAVKSRVNESVKAPEVGNGGKIVDFFSGIKSSIFGGGEKNVDRIMTDKARAKLIDEAEDWIGTPYDFGGDGEKDGIDCSHFLHKAYQDAGMEYPYSSTQNFDNVNEFEEILKSELKPGDAIIWQTTTKEGKYEGHAAIYTGKGGNRELLHAHGGKYGGVNYTRNYIYNYYEGKNSKKIKEKYFRYVGK